MDFNKTLEKIVSINHYWFIKNESLRNELNNSLCYVFYLLYNHEKEEKEVLSNLLYQMQLLLYEQLQKLFCMSMFLNIWIKKIQLN